MSRLALLTLALAALALGGGAIGFADTERKLVQMREVAPIAAAGPARTVPPVLPEADRVIDVGSSEGMAAALLQAGVAGLDAALAAQVAGSVGGETQLWLGERVGTEARSLERLSVRLGPGRQRVIERHGERFVRRDLVEQVDLTPVRIRLDGGSGLAAELVEAGLPRATRDRLLGALHGETFAAVDLIVAHEAGVSGSRYGDPLYLGAVGGDGRIRRWIGEGGSLQLLGAEEEAPAGLLRPLPGRVTSNPGLRLHPILRFLRWHDGTDFASPHGTPVQAAAEGRVIAAGWQGGYGRTLRLLHRDGSTTLYAHLSALHVSLGDEVGRGAVIGRVGASGLATGPHLHFEWRRGGETLQPRFAPSVPGAGADITPEQQAALRALLSAPFRLPPDRSS